MPTGAPDHFKRILLYGLYNGAATPLACDEQGRLILVTEPVSPFDKSGTILTRDTFEDGLIHCYSNAVGTGGSVTIYADEAMQGGHSCKLVSGSDSDRLAHLYYSVAPSSFLKHGLQFSVRWVSNVYHVTIDWYVYAGTTRYRAYLYYDWGEQTWYVYDYSNGGWTAVATGVEYREISYLFYTIKIVIDLANGRYHRLDYGIGSVDLSDYQLFSEALAYAPYADCRIEITSEAGNNAIVYFDDIIFTQDES